MKAINVTAFFPDKPAMIKKKYHRGVKLTLCHIFVLNLNAFGAAVPKALHISVVHRSFYYPSFVNTPVELLLMVMNVSKSLNSYMHNHPPSVIMLV